MARRRRGGGGDGGGGANWMDTYGDMVTLLLCFFVLLFSFSTIDAEKWEALVGSLTGTGTSIIPAMNLQTVVDSPVTLEINTATADDPYHAEGMEEGATRDLEVFLSLVQSLEDFIEENNLNAVLDPNLDTLTVTLRVNENIFFDSGDATVKTAAYPLLDDLAQLFADNMDIIDVITIEGHTDTDPINTAVYQDNWDLSTKRATNAVRYLLKNDGIDVTKMIPVGMSEYHPIESNDTAEGKAANRRVDFVIQSVVTSQ